MTSKTPAQPIRSLPEEEYTRIVSELEAKYSSSDNVAFDSEHIMAELIKAMGGLYGGVTSDSKPKDWWFFRVRARSSFSSEGQMFERQQHSYPPVEYCKEHGRCNIPGHPVFYGADSHECAIQEMKRPDERDFVLSFWRLAPQPMTITKFLCASNIKNGRLFEHKTKILQDACEQHGMTDELNGGRLRAFLEAWSDLFLSSEYVLSSAISHRLLYDRFSGHQDFLSYGSALDSRYINFALPTQLADKLELVRVFKVSLDKDDRTVWSSYWNPGSEKIWCPVEPKHLPYFDNRVRTGFIK